MYNQIIIVLIVIIIIIILYRLNYSIKKESFKTTNEQQIAFLFLTYNNLKRQDIWNKFLDIKSRNNEDAKDSEEDNDKIINQSKYANKFSIYNHAKEPEKITDILLKGKHIPEHIETCWGCFGSVEANILMMKEALKDPLNKKFILVSESCAPIVSFDKFYNEIMKNDKSRINFWKENVSTDRYDSIIDPEFPKSEFKKNSGQGLIFNRTYAELLVNSLNKYKKKWKDMTCVDEHYFGNLLIILDPKFNDNTELKNVTFDMWQSDKLNFTNITNDDIKPDHYVNLKKISNKGIDRIREYDFMFTRKIDKETDIDIEYILS